jgi:hypothetical protein
MDQFGYVGLSASIKIRAERFRYMIEPIVFPMYPKVNTWTTWIAAVDDTALARQNNARFHWTISLTNYDSIQISGADSSILKLRWSGVVSNTIGVSAMDNSNNTSPSYLQNIFVRRYGPSIKITTTKPLNSKTTDQIRITASAIDSNIDGTVTTGTIKRIIWQRMGNNSVKDSTTDSTWQISSNNPDTFEVYAWAQDIDGYLSQPDSIQIMIRAYRPYIMPAMPNITVYKNSSVGFKVSGHVSDPTAVMEKYLWDFDGSGTWDDSSTTDSITHPFLNAGKTTVIVKCRDNNNMESIPDTFFVTVSAGAPARPVMTHDTAWLNDSALYKIVSHAMNPNAKLKTCYVKWDAASSFAAFPQTSDTAKISYAYNSPGLQQVSYFVMDDINESSDTVTGSVMVHSGMPTVKSVSIDSALSKIFINDMLHFTVQGFDTNGRIDSIQVSWTGKASAFTQTLPAIGSAATFAKAFGSSGADTILFRVYDNDKLTADTTVSIFVRQGKPVITSIATDTPSTRIFTGLPVKFTVSGGDTNGSIAVVKVAWNNDTTAWSAMTLTNGVGISSNTFTQAQTGTRQIRFRVIDNDGLSRDSVLTVLVHTGKPKVLTFTPDSAVFIKRAYTYTISAIDTNGNVASYFVSWDGGTFTPATGTSTPGTSTATLTQTLTSAGKHPVLVYVKDNDGLYSDTLKDTIVVRLCAPVISRISIDTTGNNIFVGDSRTFSVSARDTNGFVRKIYFNWDGGAGATPAAVDSIVIPLTRNLASIDTFFQHVYDTTMSSPPSRIIRVWARDDDSIVSTSTKDTTIAVRLGRPVLWGDKGDTLWIPIANGPGTYYMHVNTIDTNGINSMPVNWYWNSTNTLIGATISQADSVPIDILQGLSPFPIGSGQARYIFARDNDSLIGYNITGIGHPFIVYADSAPPAPTISYSKVNGQIQIGWLGKDAKDGNGTLFEILLKKGSAPANPDTLFNFKSGTTLSPGLNGYDFSYTFGPSGGAGTYYYQVVAKDARGSISYSTASFFIFP